MAPITLAEMRRRALAWLKACLPSAERRHLVVMMWRRERALSLVLVVWILFNAFWPVALLAMSRVVGSIPGAAAHGISSPAGHHLIAQLIVFGVFYLALLASSPLGSGLEVLLRARLSRDYQQRLISAVSGPVGVQHLEDPMILDKIELAQGTLVAVYPADAPLTYANVLTMRIQGTLSCVVLGTFRWWIGLALALVWLAVRRPVRSSNQMQVRTFEERTARMRRAWYFTGLSIRPGAAKEVRVFGLGGWLVDQLDRHWRDGMEAVWTRDTRRVQILPVLGLLLGIVYVSCITYVTHLAAGGHVGIGQLSLLLGLMPTTNAIAGISVGDGQLYWMLSALPKLDELERELDNSARPLAGTTEVGSMPRQAIRFESVEFSYPGSNTPVFEGLSLEFAAGRSTAIVGANGAGKTTLVKLLARLHDPVNGRITADGRDVEQLDASEWQQRIAVVFQDFNRYSISARDNIAYGSIAHRDDLEGIEAAALAVRSARVHRAPSEGLGHDLVPRILRRNRPLGWPMAAPCPRPGTVRGPAPRWRACARRADVVDGRARGGRVLRAFHRAHAGPDDGHHLPSLLDGAPGRPHLRPRTRPIERGGEPRGIAEARWPLQRDVPAPGVAIHRCRRRRRVVVKGVRLSFFAACP